MFDGVVKALNDVCENMESPAMSKVEIKTDIRVRVSWQSKEGSLWGILWPWACSFMLCHVVLRDIWRKRGFLEDLWTPTCDFLI